MGEILRPLGPLVCVVGARPNYMKMAPLLRAFAQPSGLPGVVLVHTGQHYDVAMNARLFADLDLPSPDVNLEVGSGTHAVQTADVMKRFEPVVDELKPSCVVVVGDVNSTLACALVASKKRTPIVHIEAGLRSFDRDMPEEINRILTDQLADVLYTTERDAADNLAREGVGAARIEFVGNVMIDSLLANLPQARRSGILGRLDVKPGGFVFVTLHRPSNVDMETKLGAIVRELRRLSRRLSVVFPMHPRTRKMCERYGLSLAHDDGFRIIDPVGYHDSLRLTEAARFVLTDSGGLQEESTFFRTPCLTLRPNTERPVTVTVGSNRLTGLARLADDVDRCLRGEQRVGAVPPLWDGHAAVRIVDSLLAAETSGDGSQRQAAVVAPC